MRNSTKTLLLLAIIVVATSLVSCKKEKSKVLPDAALALLPEKFANDLVKNGFVFYTGNNPAIADNIYLFEPVNDYDNSGAFSPGSTALDAKIKIANQSGDKADIYIYNWIVGAYDTSDANIIIGDGNNITAIAQAKGSSGGVTYKYDYVISGTLTASGLSNIKFAFVMIDNPGAFLVATTGTQRIFHDADGIAELTSTFRLNNQLPPNSTKEPKSIFSK